MFAPSSFRAASFAPVSWSGLTVAAGGGIPLRLRRRVRNVLRIPAIFLRHRHRLGALVSVRFRTPPATVRQLAVAVVRQPVVRQSPTARTVQHLAITTAPTACVRFPAIQSTGGRVRIGGPAQVSDADIITALLAIDRHRTR